MPSSVRSRPTCRAGSSAALVVLTLVVVTSTIYLPSPLDAVAAILILPFVQREGRLPTVGGWTSFGLAFIEDPDGYKIELIQR